MGKESWEVTPKSSTKVEKTNPRPSEASVVPVLAELVRVATAAKIEDDENIDPEEVNKVVEDLVDVKVEKKDRRSKRNAFTLGTISGSLMAKLKAAFMGKAMYHGNTYRPKRHVGGEGFSKILKRLSTDPKASEANLAALKDDEDEEDKQSQDTLSDEEVEEVEEGETYAEKARESYLNLMDFIERWPGRLDESEIESEGSSIDEFEFNDMEEGQAY